MSKSPSPPPTAATQAVKLLATYDPALAGKLKAQFGPIAADISKLMARFKAKHYTRPGVPVGLNGQGTFEQTIPDTVRGGNPDGPGLRELLGKRADVEGDLADIGEKVSTGLPLAEEIFDLLVATPRADEVRWWLSQQWARYTQADRQSLVQLERATDQAKREGNLQALAACIGATAKRQERLKQLGWDAGQRQRQAAAAIEHLGGRDVLTSDTRAALQASGKHEEATTAWAAALALGVELEALDEQLCGLEPDSRLAKHLEGKLADTRKRWEQAKATAHDQAEAKLKALIDQAAAGDEGSIGYLKSLASSVPAAFPEGFAAAWDTLGLSDQQLTGVIGVLIED